MEGVDEGGGVEEERPVRQVDLTLGYGLEVVLGDGGLADRPGRQVHYVVAVVDDLGEKRGDAGLGPVLPDDGEDVAQDVRLGDGPVDVGDDQLVGGLPPVDVAAAARGALVGGGDAELHLVRPRLETELLLRKKMRKNKKMNTPI